jgi:phage host-nuclease inhibitor protein Gam
MRDMSLEERNAALVSWLNDLTTVYEKCAKERDAQKESASYLAGKLAEVDRERLRLEEAARNYIALVESYTPSSFLRRENNGMYIVLQAYADQFRDAISHDQPHRDEWTAQRLDDAARIAEEP